MAFYWWCHWFWITHLSVQLLHNGNTHARAYPSQDWSNAIGHEAHGLRHIITLHQSWTTPTQSTFTDLTNKITEPLKVTVDNNLRGSAISDFNDDSGIKINVNLFRRIVDDKHDKEPKLMRSQNQVEIKRSRNFTVQEDRTEPLINYTKSNRIISLNTKNTSCSICSSMGIKKTNNGIPEVSTTTEATKTTITSSVNCTSQIAEKTLSMPKAILGWQSNKLQNSLFKLNNSNKEDEQRRADSKHNSLLAKLISREYKHSNHKIKFSNYTKSLLTRSASPTDSVSDYSANEGNVSSEALSVQRGYFLDSGSIMTTCFSIFGICCTIGTIGIVLYKRRFVNKPQSLSEPDSSVYIDDSTMRDNSDEMYSLDNDSFLNSLEAMTIQNYWTDTVKHTKL